MALWGSQITAGLLDFKGAWNANTNTPTLASGVGVKSDIYRVSVAGSTNLDGITTWDVGDWAWFDGSVWRRIDASDNVTSVFGRMGDILALAGDYTDAKITNTASGVPGTYTKDAIEQLANDRVITKDPTGFTDPAAVSIAYDSATRKVTLTGTVVLYWRGVVVGSIIASWESSAHDSTLDRNYYLYWNGSAAVWSTTVWNYDQAQIAFVHYYTADKFAIRDCHGLMQWAIHKEMHERFGTYRTGGGDDTGIVLLSTTAADRRPIVSECYLQDEDLPSTLPALSSSQYTVANLTGAAPGTMVFTKLAADIIPLAGAQPYWNEYTGGAYQQTLMANNSYTAVWKIGIPVTTDAGSQSYRFIFLQGQKNSLVLETIRALDPRDVSLGDIAVISPEYVFITKYIVKYTGGNWHIHETQTLTGSRVSQTANPGGALTSVTIDASLSGAGTTSSPLIVPRLTKVFYVSKNGSDANDGLTPSAAKLTIGAAETAAFAATPAIASTCVIVVLDSAQYSESVTLRQYISLWAPNAELSGNLIINDDCNVRLRKLAHSSGIGLLKSSGSGSSYADIDEIISSSSATNAVSVSATGATLHLKIKLISGRTFGVGSTSVAQGTIYMDIDRILNTANGGTAVSRTGAGLFYGRIGSIADSGISGMGINIDAGTAHLHVGSLSNFQEVIVGATGTLNLFCQESPGLPSLGVGAVYNVASPPGLKYSTIEAGLDGQGFVIAAASKVEVQVPFDAYISAWYIYSVGGIASNTTVAVWRDSYANYPPTVADLISAASPMTLAASDKGTGDPLAGGWTIDANRGDTIVFNVTANTAATRLRFVLDIYRIK